MSTDVDKRILRIPAFGCNNFELGTLYNARTDEIVPTDFTLWKPSDLTTPKVTHNTHTTCTVIASDKLSQKLKKTEGGRLPSNQHPLWLARHQRISQFPQQKPKKSIRIDCSRPMPSPHRSQIRFQQQAGVQPFGHSVYDDFSTEEDVTFKEIWSRELIKVVDSQRYPINLDLDLRIKKNECRTYVVEYTSFSRKVIEYMKSSPFTKFGESSRPRCDSCCPICKALCIEAANHDTRITPHNAIHQPAGIVGVCYREHSNGRYPPEQIPNSLIPRSCSQRYAEDRKFFANRESEEMHSFKDFSRVFPGWKNPLINEDVPLRQYIFAKYNDEIAEQYHMEPCVEIPRNYYRDLWAVMKQLEMDTQTLNLEIAEYLGMFRY